MKLNVDQERAGRKRTRLSATLLPTTLYAFPNALHVSTPRQRLCTNTTVVTARACGNRSPRLVQHVGAVVLAAMPWFGRQGAWTPPTRAADGCDPADETIVSVLSKVSLYPSAAPLTPKARAIDSDCILCSPSAKCARPIAALSMT